MIRSYRTTHGVRMERNRLEPSHTPLYYVHMSQTHEVLPSLSSDRPARSAWPMEQNHLESFPALTSPRTCVRVDS